MTCSDDAWHTLWTEFNRLTTETIRVPRAALNEVVFCHDDKIPPDLIATQPRSDSNTVEVRRAALFAFLTDHPRVCKSL